MHRVYHVGGSCVGGKCGCGGATMPVGWGNEGNYLSSHPHRFPNLHIWQVPLVAWKEIMWSWRVIVMQSWQLIRIYLEWHPKGFPHWLQQSHPLQTSRIQYEVSPGQCVHRTTVLRERDIAGSNYQASIPRHGTYLHLCDSPLLDQVLTTSPS